MDQEVGTYHFLAQGEQTYYWPSSRQVEHGDKGGEAHVHLDRVRISVLPLLRK